jgi:uncharacterized protein (DUF697 family)
MVLNYAILNGALELLPQSWASMAIIPLQIKMVYRVGVAHGVSLDQGHIKEFIAAAGVGLTSQYIEQFGRKLLGGLVGKAGGKLLGGITGQATGMAFSFASTYALGHLAKRYYAGGRVMSTDLLRQTYQGLLGSGKTLQQQHLGDIQTRASTLDAGEVMRLVRGSSAPRAFGWRWAAGHPACACRSHTITEQTPRIAHHLPRHEIVDRLLGRQCCAELRRNFPEELAVAAIDAQLTNKIG